MKSLRVFVISCVLIFFSNQSFLLAQGDDGPKLGLVLGISSWFNNCDIPAGGQDSGLQPSFGPNFLITYGKFRFGATFFVGNFDIEPDDGVTFGANLDPAVNPADTVVYSDSEARQRGFTSIGDTKRIDFTVNVGYSFHRTFTWSISFIVNRHEVDVLTYWPPTSANGTIVFLPNDRQAPFAYTDTQLWLGNHFSGSIPVETVSTRFSIFYGVGALVILGESGTGTATHPSGNPVVEVGARTTYTAETGGIAFPPRALGSRSFGDNFGITLNIGAGFQLFNEPGIGIYGGYNFKFFAESETDIIDHSRFHGPFFGLSWTVH